MHKGRKEMMKRGGIALGCATMLLASSMVGTANAGGSQGAEPGVRTVITGIDGTIVAANAEAKRLIVAGTDDGAPQAGATSYALIDTVG